MANEQRKLQTKIMQEYYQLEKKMKRKDLLSQTVYEPF